MVAVYELQIVDWLGYRGIIIIMLVTVGQCIMLGLTFEEEVPESSVIWKRCWEEYDWD